MGGLKETAEAIKAAAVSSDVQVEVVTTDVASEEDVEGLLEQAVRRFGRVDYACNAAGTYMGPLLRNGGWQSQVSQLTLVGIRCAEQQREIGCDDAGGV